MIKVKYSESIYLPIKYRMFQILIFPTCKLLKPWIRVWTTGNNLKNSILNCHLFKNITCINYQIHHLMFSQTHELWPIKFWSLFFHSSSEISLAQVGMLLSGSLMAVIVFLICSDWSWLIWMSLFTCWFQRSSPGEGLGKSGT